MVVVRIAVACLLFVHGSTRLLKGEVPGFAGFLQSQGLPGVLAVGITALEWLGPVCLILGRFVRYVAPLHMLVLISGIVMVHRQNGWFVVGGGTGGMEYSVLLVCCLAAVTWDDLTRRP